jgi:hypothetical protein
VLLAWYFLGASLASGSAISSGLFVPTLLMGAAIGRICGLATVDIAEHVGQYIAGERVDEAEELHQQGAQRPASSQRLCSPGACRGVPGGPAASAVAKRAPGWPLCIATRAAGHLGAPAFQRLAGPACHRPSGCGCGPRARPRLPARPACTQLTQQEPRAAACAGGGSAAEAATSQWTWIDPGFFALVGAGAFMSGVMRLTVALAVIMIEISDDVHMLLPVLVGAPTPRRAGQLGSMVAAACARPASCALHASCHGTRQAPAPDRTSSTA